MSNIKVVITDIATFIGDVVENIDGKTLDVVNPFFIVPTEREFQVVPALQLAGVDQGENTITLRRDQLTYSRLFEPLAGIANAWKESVGEIITPESSIFIPE